jgi:hypothetical protein
LGGEKMDYNRYKKSKFELVISSMRNKRNYCIRILCLVILFTLFVNYISIDFISFNQNAIAEQKNYDVQEFQEKIIIPFNNFKNIEINFQKGNELEVIFTLQVKDGLPIDIWFVNQDNYVLLTNGAQFLYFIDGTGSQISYANRIVTLTDHDVYELVMTNYYSNQTVEIDVTGEMRTYSSKSSESTQKESFIFQDTQFLLYSLVFIITILGILLVVLGFKIKRFNNNEVKKIDKKLSKKNKSDKLKKNKAKDKEMIFNKRKKNKNTKIKVSKEIRKTNKVPTGFCGYCGESVNTPFCKNCGKKI